MKAGHFSPGHWDKDQGRTIRRPFSPAELRERKDELRDCMIEWREIHGQRVPVKVYPPGGYENLDTNWKREPAPERVRFRLLDERPGEGYRRGGVK